VIRATAAPRATLHCRTRVRFAKVDPAQGRLRLLHFRLIRNGRGASAEFLRRPSCQFAPIVRGGTGQCPAAVAQFDLVGAQPTLHFEPFLKGFVRGTSNKIRYSKDRGARSTITARTVAFICDENARCAPAQSSREQQHVQTIIEI